MFNKIIMSLAICQLTQRKTRVQAIGFFAAVKMIFSSALVYNMKRFRLATFVRDRTPFF